MKRLCCLMIAVLMAAMLAVGCQGKETAPEPTEPIKQHLSALLKAHKWIREDERETFYGSVISEDLYYTFSKDQSYYYNFFAKQEGRYLNSGGVWKLGENGELSLREDEVYTYHEVSNELIEGGFLSGYGDNWWTVTDQYFVLDGTVYHAEQ